VLVDPCYEAIGSLIELLGMHLPVTLASLAM